MAGYLNARYDNSSLITASASFMQDGVTLVIEAGSNRSSPECISSPVSQAAHNGNILGIRAVFP
jgi:hypothetical protein